MVTEINTIKAMPINVFINSILDCLTQTAASTLMRDRRIKGKMQVALTMV
jgi:hypothetical protein